MQNVEKQRAEAGFRLKPEKIFVRILQWTDGLPSAKMHLQKGRDDLGKQNI